MASLTEGNNYDNNNTETSTPHPSDDGTERVQKDVDDMFLKWLKDNGARFPKVLWPSRDTVGGVRGAIAIETIETNEPIMYIPHKLLISPPVARSSPEIGHIFIENQSFFRGDDDLLLSTYIMYEESRGKDSFWYPFLAMLPRPGSISDWNEEEMKEVQDDHLIRDAKSRPSRIKLKYEKLMSMLEADYGTWFNREVHTYDRFRHAWMTIQARAFGRRLPWTALVPFADTLNHTNVQTKYDFNVNSNETFRLFPTGRNRYEKGAEVFNSYGRRDNHFLLMEYGFALLNNEWDTVDMTLMILDTDIDAERKRELLKQFYISTTRRFKLRWGRLNIGMLLLLFIYIYYSHIYIFTLHIRYNNFITCTYTNKYFLSKDMLSFCRLRCMTVEELNNPENEMKFFGQGVSFENETKAIDMYKSLLNDKLNAYPTTYEEDAAILNAANDISPRLVAATRYRHSKKRIIMKQLEILNAMAPLVRLLLAQEQTGLFPNDSKSLRVKSLKKYVDSIMDMATLGMEQMKMEQQGKNSIVLGDPNTSSTKLVMGRHVVSTSSTSSSAATTNNNSNNDTVVGDTKEDGNYDSMMLDLNAMDDEFLNAKLEADEKKKTEELLERLTHLEMPSE